MREKVVGGFDIWTDGEKNKVAEAAVKEARQVKW